MAQVYFPPATIVLNRVGPETPTGSVTWSLLPKPSWPAKPSPQQNAFPAALRAQV
jgi:hypothetical protein